MFYLVGCYRTNQNHWEISLGAVLSELLKRIASFQPDIELAGVKTCHRLEVYCYADDPEAGRLIQEMAGDYLKLIPDSPDSGYWRIGPAVIEHLFNVSSGLESLVVGESEILGQLRECLRESERYGQVGPMLKILFGNAVIVGKKARTETEIGKGSVSYPGLVWEIIKAQGYAGEGRALIIGTGKLSDTIGRILVKQGITPDYVAGRDPSKAASLAQKHSGTWHRAEAIPQLLGNHSIVIGASAAATELIPACVADQFIGQKLIIDLSSPSIVASAIKDNPNWSFYGLDELQRMANAHVSQRRQAMAEAGALAAKAVEATILEIYRRKQSCDFLEKSRQILAEGQASLAGLLDKVENDRLRREICDQWNAQLRRIMHLSVTAGKLDSLGSGPEPGRFLPVVLSVVDKPVLLVGGGKVALRKAQKLLEAGATVTVLAPTINEQLSRLCLERKCRWIEGYYQPESLTDQAIVVAATSDRSVNQRIVADARRRNLLVSSADGDPDADFIFPAVIRRGDLLVAISTSGRSPMVAKQIRQELEALFDPELFGAIDRDGDPPD
jgi:precorrin-2 dehydrogenase/sirohydrochlorin ferrochelatase